MCVAIAIAVPISVSVAVAVMVIQITRRTPVVAVRSIGKTVTRGGWEKSVLTGLLLVGCGGGVVIRLGGVFVVIGDVVVGGELRRARVGVYGGLSGLSVRTLRHPKELRRKDRGCSEWRRTKRGRNRGRRKSGGLSKRGLQKEVFGRNGGWRVFGEKVCGGDGVRGKKGETKICGGKGRGICVEVVLEMLGGIEGRKVDDGTAEGFPGERIGCYAD